MGEVVRKQSKGIEIYSRLITWKGFTNITDLDESGSMESEKNTGSKIVGIRS